MYCLISNVLFYALQVGNMFLFFLLGQKIFIQNVLKLSLLLFWQFFLRVKGYVVMFILLRKVVISGYN